MEVLIFQKEAFEEMAASVRAPCIRCGTTVRWLIRR